VGILGGNSGEVVKFEEDWGKNRWDGENQLKFLGTYFGARINETYIEKTGCNQKLGDLGEPTRWHEMVAYSKSISQKDLDDRSLYTVHTLQNTKHHITSDAWIVVNSPQNWSYSILFHGRHRCLKTPGVSKAVDNVKSKIAPALLGKERQECVFSNENTW